MINLMREMQEKINRLEQNQAQPKQLTPQLPPLPNPVGIQSVAGPSSSNLNTSYTALPPFSSLFNQTPTKDQSLNFTTTLSGRSVRKRNYGENEDEGILSSLINKLFNLKYFFRPDEEEKKRSKKQNKKNPKGSVKFTDSTQDDNQTLIIPNSQPEVGKRPLQFITKSSQFN